MTDNEFFKLDQEQWFVEFVEQEPPAIPARTNPHTEKFVFEDVPW